MCTSPACPNGDTAFQYKHASQRRTMFFFQYSKLLWISTCSSFLLKNQTLFGFYSLSLAIASWIMPCVSCVDSDDDVYNFTSYYFPMNWLTVRKLVHLAYIYTLWFGKLKSFFFPKWQESHWSHMCLKLQTGLVGGVPGYLKWIIGVGFSGSKKLCGFGYSEMAGHYRCCLYINSEIVQAALQHPEGVA